MAANVGFEILVDSGQSADKKAQILDLVLSAVSRYTTTITYAATYSAGTTSKNGVSIEVEGTGEDFGIRVTLDSAVITRYATVLDLLLSVVSRDSTTLTFSDTAYTAGNRAYNVSIALS